MAIRNYHSAGNTATISVPLAVLAAVFDRLGFGFPHETAIIRIGDALVTGSSLT